MCASFQEIMSDRFVFVKTVSQSADKTAVVLRHKDSGTEIVRLRCQGNADVYKALQSIRHPNLPVVYSVTQQDDCIEVIEAYVPGLTVAEVLQTGLYTEDGVRTVIREICSALDTLHAAHIIHRDIKPENVVIEPNGQVCLIDFDAARIYKSYQPQDTSLIGTAGFAAPEQYGFNQTDPRSDIFTLGILMNVMLTGEHPSKRLYAGKLRRVIETCIRIDPNMRYGSARDLFLAL